MTLNDLHLHCCADPDRLPAWVWTFPASVVYFLLDHEDNILYVGQTEYLPSRIRQHHDQARIPFSQVLYVQVEDSRRLALEKAFIRYLRPPFNIQHTTRDAAGCKEALQEIRKLLHCDD